ncbi:unnamed protein product [Durusdinium trenchii]|uniref:Uncharacterized protein n=1 Tax=Durusdinium trenchii TaxID=1381693 RepID=A0ABP0QA29_9DINO
MAGPSIFQRNRIPLDASEPIPDVTENVWNGKTSPSEQAVPPEAEQVARPVQEPPEPLGKAKARKVGKPPEEGPPKPERRVCMVLLRASGAGQETCNQDYRYNGLHQGKPMFKAENGAVIYFNKFWKMNKVFKTTGWIYCTKDSNGSFPAEGRWSSEGTSDPNGAGRPPSLLLMDEPQPRVVDEESGALVLEDGQKAPAHRRGGTFLGLKVGSQLIWLVPVGSQFPQMGRDRSQRASASDLALLLGDAQDDEEDEMPSCSPTAQKFLQRYLTVDGQPRRAAAMVTEAAGREEWKITGTTEVFQSLPEAGCWQW